MAYTSFESESSEVPVKKKSASSRHRRKGYRKARQAAAEAAEAAPDALADPLKPIPNLKAADTFEVYYERQQLVHSGPEWARFISTLHRALPVTFRVSSVGEVGRECRQSLNDLIATQCCVWHSDAD